MLLFQFLGVLGERWPDCQIKKCSSYASRQKALKCRLCGLGEEVEILNFVGMMDHVEEEHPGSIPTCSKCGITHEYSSVVARHEEVCGLPSQEKQARFVQHFATNPEARYNLQRSRNETKQCPTLAKYVNERRIRNREEFLQEVHYSLSTKNKQYFVQLMENLDTGMIKFVRQNTEDRTCIICQDAERKACLVPCGHANYCLQCANYLKEGRAKGGPKCPECRKDIKMVMEDFSTIKSLKIEVKS